MQSAQSLQGIFGQMYSKYGMKLEPEFQINSYTYKNQTNPCAAALANGGFVVCWMSASPDSWGSGIFGQIYNNVGNRQGSEFLVNMDNNHSQSYPDVTGLSSGRFIVTWVSHNQDGDRYGIFGQIFNNNGTKIGPEFQVNTSVQGNQLHPAAISLSNGNFLICWQSSHLNSETSVIYGQLFDNDGKKVEAELRIGNNLDKHYQSNPHTSSLPNERFVVCYESYDQVNYIPAIYGIIFNNDGTRASEDFIVVQDRGSHTSNPSICTLANGDFVVCWGQTDGSGWGVWGRIYDEQGSGNYPVFLVNTQRVNSQRMPSVSALPDDGFIVTWSSMHQDGSEDGVFAKYYTRKINHDLKPFHLLDPEREITIYINKYLLKWQTPSTQRVNLPYEIQYDLYLAKNPDLNEATVFNSIWDTTYAVDLLEPETTYYWKVMARNLIAESLWCYQTYEFHTGKDLVIDNIAEYSTGTPKYFHLAQNYPNPFNLLTKIKFAIPKAERVKIQIYSSLGQRMETLINKTMKAGYHELEFNGQNLSSGIYFYRIEAGEFQDVKKMILIR